MKVSDLAMSKADLTALLRSSDPVVFMQMPGCYHRAANSAHVARFRTLAVAPAYSSDELVKYLQVPVSSFELCYCSVRKAPIAMETVDCPYESAAMTLRDKPPEAWETAVAFFREENDNERRYRVASLRLRHLDRARSILVSKELPLPNLSVSLGARSIQTDRVSLSAHVAFRKTQYQRSHQIDLKMSDSPYGELRSFVLAAIEQIRAGHHALQKIEEALLARAHELCENYQPLLALLRSFFRETENEFRQSSIILEKLTSFAESIVDAPAIRKVRDEVCEQISDAQQLIADDHAILRAGYSHRQLQSLDYLELQNPSRFMDQLMARFPDAEANWTAFQEMLPTLLKEYPGKVVAICQGQLIEVGDESFEVASRAWARADHKHVLIQPVEASTCSVAFKSPRVRA